MSNAPGWYADPWDARRLRWWDGRGWGPQTVPRPAAARGHGPAPQALGPGFAGPAPYAGHPPLPPRGVPGPYPAAPPALARPATMPPASGASSSGMGWSVTALIAAIIALGFAWIGWGSTLMALIANGIAVFAWRGAGRPGAARTLATVAACLAVGAMVLVLALSLMELAGRWSG